MNKKQIIMINNRELLFREITLQDKAQVMELFKACKEFFLLTEGVQPDNCEAFFTELPPNKKKEDKYLYGIFDKDTLIGALDLISDFPEKGEWIIGLLLLHPKTRGSGLGKGVHKVIKEIVKGEGGEKLRVGVMEENKNALHFWRKMGYEQRKVTKPIKSGIKESKIIVMNHYLVENEV